MIKNITYILTILAIIISCSQIEKEQEDLIKQILNNPENIRKICENSPYKLSDILLDHINNYEQTYMDHFIKYNSKYKLFRKYEGISEDEIKIISIFITDQKHEISTEFQFKEKDGIWIFHNIVLPDSEERSFSPGF